MNSDSRVRPLVLLNAVGMTARLLPLAPTLQERARSGWCRSLREVIPAVTSTAQATLLTGKPTRDHGIVANGWLFRDTMEVRFWQQSNRLLQAEPLYTKVKRLLASRQLPFRCAKLFWWFNQGADVAISITPKPHYGADGNKAFGIAGDPPELVQRVETRLGPFPFSQFWGPLAGLKSTQWIARCAALVLEDERPDLTLVYLPHLDYDPQRFGPSGCDLPRLVRELDDQCRVVIDAADRIGANTWIVSEYGHCDVRSPIHPNRILRRGGRLRVRMGPFGEMLDTFASEAFAVCDHQICHVYVRDPNSVLAVQDQLRVDEGIERTFVGSSRRELGLDHPRSGEIVALAKPDRWFAYPYWLDDRRAPDFARTVDIHRKCGFDPCEMFFDPRLFWPQGLALYRLACKKFGFRTLFDVIPLDGSIVRGSHGRSAMNPDDRPLLIGSGPAPSTIDLSMTDVHDLLVRTLLPS